MDNDTRLDHLVVAAADLEQGADYIEHQLGVRVPDGGQHLTQGTHNKVMSLGIHTYLEIIAVDPDLPIPRQPRWFGLDDPAIVASLRHSPRLLTWAINTPDLSDLLAQSKIGVGATNQLSRGELTWKVALTDDGRLSAGGYFPLCIQWLTDFHPASRMVDLGCRFKRLVIGHPYPDWIETCLDSIGAVDLVQIERVDRPGFLRAVIETPAGERVLESLIP